MCDCFGVIFLGAGTPGPHRYHFDGKEIVGPGGPIFHASDAVSWLQAFCLASALRREDVLSILDPYDEERLRKAPGGTFDRYIYPLVEGMRLFRRGDQKYVGLLEEAEVLSRTENLRVAPPNIVAMYRTLIAVLQSAGKRDQQAFDAACVAAVQAHKGYYSRGKVKTWPDGALAYLACGVAAIGVDRGLSYNVDSGYTPRWLVLNEAP